MTSGHTETLKRYEDGMIDRGLNRFREAAMGALRARCLNRKPADDEVKGFMWLPPRQPRMLKLRILCKY